MKRWMPLLVFSLLGCADPVTVLSLRLVSDSDSEAMYDDMSVTVSSDSEHLEGPHVLPFSPRLDLWLSDDLAGRSLTIDVRALREGRDIAAGQAVTVARQDENTDVEVVLESVDCGAVRCNKPPSPCHSEVGTCQAGVCEYSVRAGSCDDGDPCTVNDMCSGGGCAGIPATCDVPPPPECIGSSTLRRYSSTGRCGPTGCEYSPIDESCANGCSDRFGAACVVGRNVGEFCFFNSECDAGLTCIEEFCSPTCRDSTVCHAAVGSYSVCNGGTGTCTLPCDLANPRPACGPNATCDWNIVDGTPRTSCIGSGSFGIEQTCERTMQCLPGHVCRAGFKSPVESSFCIPICKRGESCGSVSLRCRGWANETDWLVIDGQEFGRCIAESTS
ncbi:MAG: hypothetical protein AAGF12_32815 [Myxococcota bacterium]